MTQIEFDALPAPVAAPWGAVRRAERPSRQTLEDHQAPTAGSLLPGNLRLHTLERLRARQGIRRSIAVIYLITAVIYLTWRATVFNPEAPVFSFVFYFAEILGAVASCFLILISWRYRIREPKLALSNLNVDVFIPTYNESAEMVRRSALAAMHIRYPHETWLLDDGNRAAIKRIADELGCRYLARTENTHAKPGNLNNALKHATGDFVVVMDADFVAQPNFADRTLGYFADPTVAFVQCPQDYYNISAYQYRTGKSEQFLWHDEMPFYQVLQPGRDYWNAASSCGTSVVYRRSALDAVGGFAPETVTEDMHTAIRLHRAGYSSAYHPEPLAFGVAPNDFEEYQKTRHRWGRGNIQGLRCERVPFSSGLSLMQRFCYLQFGVLYLEGWQRLILYLTPVVTLTTGVYPVGNTAMFFWLFVPYVLLDYLCYEEVSRGYGRVYLNEQLCMSRFATYIRATFALFSDYGKWHVSSKKIAGSLPTHLIYPQAAILGLNAIALGFGIWRMTLDEAPQVPVWITGLVCLFSLLYVVIAALVIKEARKRARYKRGEFRFEVPLPIRVDFADRAPIYETVSSISTRGMTFSSPAVGVPFSCSGLLKGVIYLPNGAIPFTAVEEPAAHTARVQDIKTNEVGVLFQWSSSATRDKLDLTLHACNWHRRLAHCGEYFTTPLEWLQQKFSRHVPVVVSPSWRTVLYRSAKDGDDALAFGLYCETEGLEGAAWLTAYRRLVAGEQLAVLDPQDRERRILVQVVGSGEAPHSSEAELDDALPVLYEVVSATPAKASGRLHAVHTLHAAP